MRRHAKNDWRTNVAQGGRAEAVTPTADEERLALQAAAAVGADGFVVESVAVVAPPAGLCTGGNALVNTCPTSCR